jgi:hypothetical protein
MLLGAVLASCTTTASDVIETRAFERCRNLSGDARQRCIEQERDAAAQDLARRDAEILDEITREEERGAMRRGEQAGRPSAAGGKAVPGQPNP